MNRFLHTNMKSILIGIMVSMASILSPTVATGQTGFWTDEGNYDEGWPEGHIVNDVYEIRDAKDLAAFARHIGNHYGYDEKTIAVTNNIDLKNHYWIPIGMETGKNKVNFLGTFNGNGHIISNISIDITSFPVATNRNFLYAAFFRRNDGIICNVNIKNIRITGQNESYEYIIGGLVGENLKQNDVGKIEGCTVFGTENMLEITVPESLGEVYIGGISGTNGYESSIINCSCNIPITFMPADGESVYIGGIAGNSSDDQGAVIKGCHNKQTISSNCNSVGGIVGIGYYIENCTNSGDIINKGSYAGGIAGYGSYLTQCSNSGNIESTRIAGGIIGSGKYSIKYCYNTGTVSVKSNATKSSCGGILGYAINSNIQSCFNSGKISLLGTTSSTFSEIGGIAAGSTGKNTIQNCYNTGDILAELPAHAGGIFANAGNISNCYNTGSIKSNANVVGIADSYSSYTIKNCLTLAQNITIPFLISTEKASRITPPRTQIENNNNYANAPMLIQIENQISKVSENIAHNDANGANWEDTDNTNLPISNWPDDAWDKSNNTILPQLKYEDGTLMPGQPSLLKSDFPTETPSEPEQPASPSDATLKSLSYQIGNDGQVTPVPNFSPDVYQYEIGYKSNEDAIAAGQSPIYPDGTRVYPTGVATNEKAQVLPSDMLLPYGFVKVGVASEDKSTERTYSLFMMSEKDAGKKYYVMMNLKNMTVQINGTTYKNGDIYKANHNENVTVKLIPAQGYKLPSSIQIDEGSSISFLELGQTSEINLREINWHMGLSASAVENTGQEDNNIFVHDNLKYRITGNNTVTVVGPDVAEGSGTQGNDNDSWTIADCVIPSTITHNSIAYQVKAIEDRAFSGAINMKTITLPEGLETIGYEAFYRCYELKTLHIPASVTSIKVKEDEIFFSKLDIESISVASDNKVYASLDGLLYNKSMTTLLFCPYFNNNREITLPEGVTTLRQYVFAYQDSLISVTLPESLKSISNYAFYQCDGLVNIHFKGQQPPLAAESAFESSKLVHLIAYVPKGYKNAYTDWGIFLPENIIEEGSEEEADTFIEGLFKYRKLTENTVAVIGSTITGNACDIISPVTHNNKTYQVTEIGDEAFSGLNIEKGSIPEGIRKIGSKAYENCALLEYMILPSSIEEIEYEAFNGCKKLERIQLNDGLKYIGDDAFNNTALTSIQIPASVIEIENLCEDCPSLMGIDVDSKNAYYSSEGGILYDKKQTVMLMVPQAYAGDIFSLPETLKSIDVGAFYKCKDIKTIDLPEGIEIIGECAFSLCGATSITLPSSLKQLDMCVFGDHREAIGVLKELHSKHTDPAKIKIESNTFAYVIDFNACKLYVPKGCKAKYQAAEGWKEFKQIIEEGDNLPLIPDKTDDEITLNTDSTYTDSEGNTGHFNGMIGNGEEETTINKLTIRGSASSTTTTIVINKVTVGNGSSTSETTTSVTKNTNVVIELIGDNSLGKLVNDGIAKLISKVEAALKNTVVINNGIFVDETGLLTRVEGAAELDITVPSDREVRPGENVTLTASTKVSVTYAVTFIWEQLQPDGTWKAVGSPNVYTPARSGLRSATTVTDRLTIDAKDAGKYRCVIRNKVGDVSSTLTTPPATVTAKSTVDIITPKSYRKVTPCGNQLHFEISTPTEVKIINLNGAIIRSVSLPAGDTYIDGLDKGVYILLFEDGVAQKVRI